MHYSFLNSRYFKNVLHYFNKTVQDISKIIEKKDGFEYWLRFDIIIKKLSIPTYYYKL